MWLIHGSRGLIYFVHGWKPRFNESALLSDPEMVAAVTKLIGQITRLAPVLNGPTVMNVVAVVAVNHEVPIAAMAKRTGDARSLFTLGMRDGRTTTSFTLRGLTSEAKVEALDKIRTLSTRNGALRDKFQSWDAPVYSSATAPGH